MALGIHAWLTRVGVIVWFCVASAVSAQTLRDPTLAVEEVAAGLSFPATMAFIGLDDFLVTQLLDGRVRRVVNGVLQPGEVLDVAVDGGFLEKPGAPPVGERGLMGIAVHPLFPSAPYVYLYLTESSTGDDTLGCPPPLGNRVYRYRWENGALVDPLMILDLPINEEEDHHNGGYIAFGPDKMLYAVIGDIERDGQLQNFPEGPPPDDSSAILRIADDGTSYSLHVK